AQARPRHSAGEYAALIERCRDAIRDGDAYQLCLTTRFSIDAPVDPVDAYRRLRAATPAHHGGLVRTGDVALASASPERFLEVDHGVVRTRPIKGTRARGADAATDAALAEELRTNEKERAENVMIVDLMRNDLSRVCVAGSVGVDALLQVESYPAVHQLVSTVSGALTPGATVGDVLDAAFPAGSMTGAPKLSAMTILHELESGPRGVFSGCFGWVGADGALDLAMVIRSVVVHPGGAYVGAGGGITWRSDAAAEVAEVGIKARGPLAAVGAELPPGW
ncbi:MAG: anthranilate synthase component I family protein, partial [Microbacterium sp.]